MNQWPKVSLGNTQAYFDALVEAGRALRCRSTSAEEKREIRSSLVSAFGPKVEANSPWPHEWETLESHAGLVEDDCTDALSIRPRVDMQIIIWRDNIESISWLLACAIEVCSEDEVLSKFLTSELYRRRSAARLIDSIYEENPRGMVRGEIPEWLQNMDHPSEGLWWLGSVLVSPRGFR